MEDTTYSHGGSFRPWPLQKDTFVEGDWDLDHVIPGPLVSRREEWMSIFRRILDFALQESALVPTSALDILTLA